MKSNAALRFLIVCITKSPKQLLRATLHVTPKSQNTWVSSFIHVREIEYIISANWDRSEGWNNINAGENIYIIKVTGLLEYVPGKNIKLVFPLKGGLLTNRRPLSREYISSGIRCDKIYFFRFDFICSNLELQIANEVYNQ
jgi:hypothetical protein